jgi:NCS1 family nucleobase:cation symporter-1
MENDKEEEILMGMEKKGIKGIETRSIDFVPANERYGHPRSQFYIWFGSNMTVLAMSTGAFAPLLGLNLAWSILAIVGGLLIGGLFMAFHSAQGSHLGIPQMIQSRAQFGVRGAVIPLILAIVLFLGFYSTTVYYGAQTLVPLNVPMPVAIIIAGIVTLIIGIFGYDAIHKSEAFSSYLATAVFAVVTVFALQLDLPEGTMTLGPVNWSSFILAISVYATYLITAAPYVADYSRYLPENTSIASTFWYTYLGGVIASIWMCIVGAVLYIGVPDFATNSAVGIASVWHAPFVIILFATMIITAICSSTLSLYGTFMAIVTVFSPFTKLRGTKKSKMVIMILTTIAAICIDIFGAQNMIVQWGYFMSIILYFMIPWTCVNLIDYYIIRKGKYSMEDIFDPNGIYGNYNWKTLVAFFATVVVEMPFISTVIYTGPIAKAMGGADIAWIIGGVFCCGFYYFLNRDLAKQAKEAGAHI